MVEESSWRAGGWSRDGAEHRGRAGAHEQALSPSIDKLVRQGVAFLNGDGGFENRITYREVAEVAGGLDEEAIKDVFDRLWKTDAKTIDSPTNWVCNAFVKSKPRSSSYDVDARAASHAQRDRGDAASRIDGLLRKGIAWLNNEGGFDNRIGFREVAEAADGVDEENVKDIFDSLLNIDSETIDNPTSWVCHAFRKSKPGLDRTDRKEELTPVVEKLMRKGIAWLNNEGGFANTITFRVVCAAAAGLAEDDVKDVLDQLLHTDSKKIDNPTEFVCNAFEELKAQHHPSGRSRERQVHRELSSSIEKLLRQGIAWLNKEGGFENKIAFGEVAEAAAGLNEEKVKEILERLWQTDAKKIDSPTNWVCNAFVKSKAQQQPTERPRQPREHQETPGNLESTIRKGVAWLNKDGGFENRIDLRAVVEAADGLDEDTVKDALDRLWQADARKIDSPTVRLCSALRKAKAQQYPAERSRDQREHRDAPSNIENTMRKSVAWLNNEGGFDGRISFREVADAAAGLDEEKIKSVLDRLWQSDPKKIDNPTNYVCNAFHKARPSTTQPNHDVDKMLRQGVAWLNNEGGFENRIGFDEVVEVAAGLDADTLKDILDRLLKSDAKKIDNPTNYVCNAFHKARPGQWRPQGEAKAKDAAWRR